MIPRSRIVIGMVCLAVCVHGDSWSPGGPATLLAQEEVGPVTPEATAADQPSDEGSRWASYGMGLAIGFSGFAIGAMIGAQFESSCNDLECYDEAWMVGAGLGSIGVASGVHLGNGGRGSFLLTTAVSLGIGLAGAGAALAITETPASAILALATPVVQIIAVTEVERSSGRVRARSRRAAEPSAGADDSGGPKALHRNADDRGIRLSLGLSPTVRRGEPGMALSGRLTF